MRKFLVFLIFTLFLGSFSYVNAAKNASAEAKRAAKTAAKCEKFTQNLAKKVTKYTRHRDNRLKHYANVVRKLNAIVARLEKRKADAAKIAALKAEIAKLAPTAELVTKFTTDYNTFLTELNTVKNKKCTTDTEVTNMSKAKELLTPVREDARKIKDQYKNKIKPLIKDLRVSLQEQRETEVDDSSIPNP